MRSILLPLALVTCSAKTVVDRLAASLDQIASLGTDDARKLTFERYSLKNMSHDVHASVADNKKWAILVHGANGERFGGSAIDMGQHIGVWAMYRMLVENGFPSKQIIIVGAHSGGIDDGNLIPLLPRPSALIGGPSVVTQAAIDTWVQGRPQDAPMVLYDAKKDESVTGLINKILTGDDSLTSTVPADDQKHVFMYFSGHGGRKMDGAAGQLEAKKIMEKYMYGRPAMVNKGGRRILGAVKSCAKADVPVCKELPSEVDDKIYVMESEVDQIVWDDVQTKEKCLRYVGKAPPKRSYDRAKNFNWRRFVYEDGKEVQGCAACVCDRLQKNKDGKTLQQIKEEITLKASALHGAARDNPPGSFKKAATPGEFAIHERWHKGKNDKPLKDQGMMTASGEVIGSVQIKKYVVDNTHKGAQTFILFDSCYSGQWFAPFEPEVKAAHAGAITAALATAQGVGDSLVTVQPAWLSPLIPPLDEWVRKLDISACPSSMKNAIATAVEDISPASFFAFECTPCSEAKMSEEVKRLNKLLGLEDVIDDKCAFAIYQGGQNLLKAIWPNELQRSWRHPATVFTGIFSSLLFRMDLGTTTQAQLYKKGEELNRAWYAGHNHIKHHHSMQKPTTDWQFGTWGDKTRDTKMAQFMAGSLQSAAAAKRGKMCLAVATIPNFAKDYMGWAFRTLKGREGRGVRADPTVWHDMAQTAVTAAAADLASAVRGYTGDAAFAKQYVAADLLYWGTVVCAVGESQLAAMCRTPANMCATLGYVTQ
jgi:hypothetical protein